LKQCANKLAEGESMQWCLASSKEQKEDGADEEQIQEEHKDKMK
jgi:hypothetical protein